ncbi:hypothetical protein BJ138DRAFT_1103884 [Hygrophoropsis aurantiaca]|uniref:Uncharacterized protein n=1 Tax=Hygrophoropsis aurantiaca TaxID=72124 RepID=A0ACB8A4L1_9AGAM|nr:hypothetical protein BJ138DRAFT_1103884 [Hygrophoropsis aurantiaca]
MYRQFVVFAAVSFAGLQLKGAFAQSNSTGVCLASTGFNWTTNSMNQSPCQVANALFAANPCNQSGISYPAMTTDTYYAGPLANQATACTCGTVIYSLTSACALCQNGGFLGYNAWISSCDANITLYQVWPASIPSDTTIPPWAYLPLVNGQFDNLQGQSNASAVAAEGTSTSSSTAISSTTSSAATITTSTAPASSGSSASTTSASARSTGASTGSAGKTSASVGRGFAGAVFLSLLGVF